MTLIKDRVPKQSTGSYQRIFGNDTLNNLMQRVQSTSIANGHQLEHIIEDIAYGDPGWQCYYPKLDNFIEQARNIIVCGKSPVDIDINCGYLFTKNDVRDSKHISTNHETDYLILSLADIDGYGTYQLYATFVEMKDGWVFDTKKSAAERKFLLDSIDCLANSLNACGFEDEHFYIGMGFCGFSAETQEDIYLGSKKNFYLEECLTAEAFCDLICEGNTEDYDGAKLVERIDGHRYKDDQEANLVYFLQTLLLDEALREKIEEILNEDEDIVYD